MVPFFAMLELHLASANHKQEKITPPITLSITCKDRVIEELEGERTRAA
jgi:hypothetical protein